MVALGEIAKNLLNGGSGRQQPTQFAYPVCVDYPRFRVILRDYVRLGEITCNYIPPNLRFWHYVYVT